MERRGFLKAIGAGMAFLSLPNLGANAFPPPLLQPVYTADGLAGALESLFTCRMGEPAAFMQWTDMLAAHQWLTPNAFQAVRNKEKELIRITYQTIGYAIEGGDAKEAEAKLVQFCYEEFEAIAKGDEKKMLIWRSKPQFETFDHVKWGKTFMTAEEIEDRVDLRKEQPPIQVPENVEWDWETQSLRFFEEKTKVHKIRMRLAIPEYRVEEASFVKPEGEPYLRLEKANG